MSGSLASSNASRQSLAAAWPSRGTATSFGAAGDEEPRLVAAMRDRRQVVRLVEHVRRVLDLARVGDERRRLTVSSPSGSWATPGEPVIGSGNACVRSWTKAS